MPAMKRISKGRSKLGCATCKKRRVKCDEARPSCLNCTHKGFRCEGVGRAAFVTKPSPPSDSEYSTTTQSRTRQSSPSGQLVMLPHRSAREIRAFSFWNGASCPEVANWTDKEFFKKLLPRVALADDATWYALIAASTLLEHPVNKRRKRKCFMEEDLDLGWHRQALEWYGCSLKAARDLPTTSSTLLRTFLYGAVEMLQDRPEVGLSLIHSSLILNESADAKNDADTEILSATLPMLSRALIPLGMFGLPLTASQRARACLPTHLKQSTAIEVTLLDHMEAVHNLIYDIQIFCNTTPTTPTPSPGDLTTQTTLLTRLSTLSTTLHPLATSTTSPEPRRFLAQLLVLHTTYTIKLHTHFSPSPLAHDTHEPLFRLLLTEATRVLAVVDGLPHNLFAWEIASVPCLYYTAWACRRPSLRRRAIELLRSHGPRQENLWSAESALGRMERVVCWEEGREEYEASVSEEEDAVLPGVKRRLPMSVVGDPLGGVAASQQQGAMGGWEGYDGRFWNVARLMTREEQGVGRSDLNEIERGAGTVEMI